MVEKRNKSRGLGRGLSALMADVSSEGEDSNRNAPRRAERTIPIERIHQNPNQPRRSFDDSALAELSASIKAKGIIQPLIVRPDPNRTDHFEIVAGERRWRAAQAAMLHELPVIVRDFDDTEMLEVAIIENIQRADLNPVDEAAGYRQLMDRFGHTQEQLATALGKSRSHIANLLRLLSLPEDVLQHLVEGRLTAGHARALVGHPDASRLADQIVQQNLSVRETEKLAKKVQEEPAKRAERPKSSAKDADTMQIENELAAALGMKVSIDHKPGSESGKLAISYQSLTQLDDLLRVLSGG